MKFCNLFYILCNLICLSCAFAAAVQTSVSSTNETNEIVISYENECRALCESCDCNGFFCGDNECICECKANTNALNNYAQCLKDIIKDNLYKYNISVQHLNDSSNDVKKSKDSRRMDNISKTIKKRSISWVMQPEGTNIEKEKVFMAEDFKFKPLNLDFVGNPFGALKGLSGLNLPTLAKSPVVGAAVPAILSAPPQGSVAAPAPAPDVAAPATDVAAAAPDVAAAAPDVAAAAPDVAAAAPDVAAEAPDVAAAAPDVAAEAPDVAAAAPDVAAAAPDVAAAAPDVAAEAPDVAAAAPDVGAAAPAPTVSAKNDDASPLVGGEQDVGTAALAALKGVKLGALAGIIGKLKAIKLPLVKAKVLGDAAVAAPGPITQPLETL